MNLSAWNPLKPFGREVADVVATLEAVVAGRLDCRDWDAFLRIPMPGTPELDKVRVACAALEPEERIGDDGIVRHTEWGRNAIEQIIRRIKNEA